MMNAIKRIDHYVSEFEAARADRNAGEPAWIAEARQSAISRFAERGFPTLKDEDWRYTSVESLAKVPFRPMAPHEGNGLTEARLLRLCFDLEGAARLVFVNGRFDTNLSRTTAAGIRIENLAAVAREEPAVLESALTRHARFDRHPFVALNTALWTDGAFLRVSEGTVVDSPIHVLYLTTPAGASGVAHPRNLIVAGEGSRATIIENYVGLGSDPYWVNPVTEVVVGPGAVIEHYKVQRESPVAFHVATVQCHQDRDSRFTSRSISLGGGLVRNDVNIVLDAEGAECRLDGLYLLSDRQHEDNHTLVDHAKPHCSSIEVYKGVLSGRARGVFNGSVVVRQDAQKTDARQTNKNLLLSDDAMVDTKPQLEILANDVKCAHAATVGQIDEASMFYLRSRGLDPDAAQALLIHAFASEVIQRIPWESIRGSLESELSARLPSGPSNQETS